MVVPPSQYLTLEYVTSPRCSQLHLVWVVDNDQNMQVYPEDAPPAETTEAMSTTALTVPPTLSTPPQVGRNVLGKHK